MPATQYRPKRPADRQREKFFKKHQKNIEKQDKLRGERLAREHALVSGKFYKFNNMAPMSLFTTAGVEQDSFIGYVNQGDLVFFIEEVAGYIEFQHEQWRYKILKVGHKDVFAYLMLPYMGTFKSYVYLRRLPDCLMR